jgi:hypothetical protein
MAAGFIQSIETGEHQHCPAIAGAKSGKLNLGIHGPAADMSSEVLVSFFDEKLFNFLKLNY